MFPGTGANAQRIGIARLMPAVERKLALGTKLVHASVGIFKGTIRQETRFFIVRILHPF